MALTKRLVKGTELSHQEGDDNLDYLRNNPDGILVPKTSGIGMKLDPAAPTFGWKDLIGEIQLKGAGANDPAAYVYRGTIREYRFNLNDEVYNNYHLPHDYVPGSDIFAHIHWSHNAVGVTSGSCTWSFVASYAKGHDQQAFGAEVTVPVVQNASLVQYQHLIAEVQLSAAGGAGGKLDSNYLEPDGLILMRTYLSALSISGANKPFVHFVDLHYQTTGILGTKQKAPNFYV